MRINKNKVFKGLIQAKLTNGKQIKNRTNWKKIEQIERKI